MNIVWKVFALASLVSVCSAIACYECTKHSWGEKCDSTQWLQCPPHITHCETFVSKGNGTVIINYSCGSDACKMPMTQARTKYMGLDQCEKDKPFYHCFDCCHDDKCNNGVSKTSSSITGIVLLVLCAGLRNLLTFG